MIYINYIFLQIFITVTFGQLSQSIVDSLPIYNPLTRCHDLTLIDEDLTFAICLQRATNKQHPYNLYTSPSFCSVNYPPYGHLVDLISLSSLTIQRIFENLINLFNTKESHIDFPEPNFLWIGSNFTQNLTNNSLWCSNQCQSKNQLGQFLIIKLRCQYGNNSKPCLTTKHTHFDRAPFICLKSQINKQEKQILSTSNSSNKNHLDKPIVFYDSTPCLIVRTNTHEYTFCFRRQICPQSQTSAFCTTKFDAYNICQKEKKNSNLLTIENDDEYQLINKIIYYYSNQTLLNSNGLIKNKYIQRAQWMWIDGLKDLNDIYRWNISNNNSLTPIKDKYWCNNLTNCSGGKGRDHIVLNIVCQTNKRMSQICLASRRHSEPGPFICKRTLKPNEAPILNYTFLRDLIPISSPDISPVYEKNLTSIYYDEHHCLTVQTHTHLYTFCLRRQNCTLKQSFCTKWSHAQKDCQLLKNQAQLLTIDNENERLLITDIVNNYFNETRLTFNGSSYRYYRLADFIWIDGIQQGNNRTYLWKNGLELIPEYLWCPKNECISIDHSRVMLNLLCKNKNSLICLSTRIEWKPAPYICKRIRSIDSCPIVFDKIRSIQSSEMLVVTVNRTIALIKCKHPDYNTQIKVQYQCNIQTNQWNLIYENKNFTCPNYVIPSMAISINGSQTAISINGSQTSRKTTTSTSTRLSYIISTIPSIIKEYDCSQSELLTLINNLPTKYHYISSEKLLSYSPLYYDMRLTCYSNKLIQVTYRCDLSTKKWIYVYGNTNNFRTCYSFCNNKERNDLLNKYFIKSEQTKICINYNKKRKSLRLKCFNQNENQWKSINYQCGTMTITKDQWYSLNSCFSSPTITTTFPTAMVSMAVTELKPSCPSPVIHDRQCEYETGQYILDVNGCLRKICPTRSRLCDTIRCPPDRICRVVVCKSCIHTDYLQAVCEYPKEPSLCEFEKQLSLLNNHESINRWVQKAIDIVQKYANEQRQQLTSPWPVLTIN